MRGIVDLVGRHGRRFHAEKAPEGDRRRPRDRAGADRHRGIGGNRPRSVAQQQPGRQCDDPDQRHQLQRHGHELHPPGEPDTADIDRDQPPDDRQRGQRRRLAQDREDQTERTHHRDRDRRIAGPDQYPIAPRDGKPRRRAERRLGKGIGTAGDRQLCTEPREYKGEAQRAADRHDPADHAVPAKRGKRRGEQIDARPDHVAHDQSEAGPETQCPPRYRLPHASLPLADIVLGIVRRSAPAGKRLFRKPVSTAIPSRPAGFCWLLFAKSVFSGRCVGFSSDFLGCLSVS